MGHRLHLLKRNQVFWWRRRLPRALVLRGGPWEIRRSLGTAEPALARLRALKLTTAFEDVLLSHAKPLRAAKPLTAWQRDQILGELYDRMAVQSSGCDFIISRIRPALTGMARQSVTASAATG